MSWRKWAFRIAAVAASPLIALVLVELGARLLTAPAEAELAFNAPDNAPDGLYSNSHSVGHIPTPGFEATAVSPGYRVQLRVNSLGMRGPEPGPDEGLERWMVGGDSFTFAAQVQEDETFVQRLASPGRELFNVGADGYGSWQPLVRYRELDEPLGLDGLLVVFFTGNDLSDNERQRMELQSAQREADGALRPSMGIPPGQRWLSRHSYLYAHYKVVQRTKELKSGADPNAQRWARELAIFTEGGQRQLSRLMNSTRPWLRGLQEATSERGDRLVIAVAPPGFAVDERRRQAAFELVGHRIEGATPRAPTDAVLQELADQGITSCDLHTPLEAAVESGDTVYFDFDGHWTPRGHEVVAEALAACMAP
jgi:hypothetical protein